MGTTDISAFEADPESLSKQHTPAQRKHRFKSRQPKDSKKRVNHSNSTKPTDCEFLTGMMETIVHDAENGKVTDTAIQNARAFSAAGRISWGEEDGKIIGVLADGTRCDVDGNVL